MGGGSRASRSVTILVAWQNHELLDGAEIDVARPRTARDVRQQSLSTGGSTSEEGAYPVLGRRCSRRTLPSDAAIRTEYEGRTITPVGTVGARVSTRFTTVIGEGPTAFQFGGMITMVLEKGPAGWRIVGGHTSSERQDGR